MAQIGTVTPVWFDQMVDQEMRVIDQIRSSGVSKEDTAAVVLAMTDARLQALSSHVGQPLTHEVVNQLSISHRSKPLTAKEIYAREAWTEQWQRLQDATEANVQTASGQLRRAKHSLLAAFGVLALAVILSAATIAGVMGALAWP